MSINNCTIKLIGTTTALGILAKPALYNWYYKMGKDGENPYAKKDKSDSHGGEEIYYVIKGKGKFILDGKEYDVEKGTMVYISPGIEHRVINTEGEDLELYWVNTPPSDALGKPGDFIKTALKGWKKIK